MRLADRVEWYFDKPNTVAHWSRCPAAALAVAIDAGETDRAPGPPRARRPLTRRATPRFLADPHHLLEGVSTKLACRKHSFVGLSVVIGGSELRHVLPERLRSRILSPAS